jgi:hypothetical protein
MSQPSDPNLRFEKFSQQLKTHISTAFAMGVDAAKKADKEKLGINDRIKVGHRFVDLEVKGHAELLETLISGPWFNTGSFDVFDTIYIDPVNYAREVLLKEDFIRVRRPLLILPKEKLSAVPRIIPSGVRKFRLYLTDLSFIGANYRGRITLQATPEAIANGAPAAPTKKVVTAGL